MHRTAEFSVFNWEMIDKVQLVNVMSGQTDTLYWQALKKGISEGCQIICLQRLIESAKGAKQVRNQRQLGT